MTAYAPSYSGRPDLVDYGWQLKTTKKKTRQSTSESFVTSEKKVRNPYISSLSYIKDIERGEISGQSLILGVRITCIRIQPVGALGGHAVCL